MWGRLWQGPPESTSCVVYGLANPSRFKRLHSRRPSNPLRLTLFTSQLSEFPASPVYPILCVFNPQLALRSESSYSVTASSSVVAVRAFYFRLTGAPHFAPTLSISDSGSANSNLLAALVVLAFKASIHRHKLHLNCRRRCSAWFVTPSGFPA